jgi:hypothetical protein
MTALAKSNTGLKRTANFINSSAIETNMSHKQGMLKGSYHDIVSVLGEPTYLDHSGDDKTQAEWNIKHENGTVLTVYDYKKYNTDVEDVKEWSIGGYSHKAVEALEDIITHYLNQGCGQKINLSISDKMY